MIGQHHATVSKQAEYGGLKRNLIHSFDGAAAALVTDARQRAAHTFIAYVSSKHAPNSSCWSPSCPLHSFAYEFACARSRRLIGHRRQQHPLLLQTGHPSDLRSFQPLFQWTTVIASVSRLSLRLRHCTAPLPTGTVYLFLLSSITTTSTSESRAAL